MRRARAGLLLMVAVTSCGPSAPSPTPAAPTASPTPTATPAPPTPTPAPVLMSPAIIQVENSAGGRPQSGLATADLVYEYVAEGGVGRFSVFFFTAPPAAQEVGPVRSARTVTLQLASLFHGFVAYSGASAYIGGLLRRAAFPSYDEDSARGNLFRIATRAPPHNLYTDGQHIAALARTAKAVPVTYQLWARNSAPIGGVTVTSFTVPVSPSERPLFTWQPELKGFARAEDTGVMLDPANGAPLILPTVIVQQVAVTTDRRVVDVDGHLGVDDVIAGSGTAQVFTAGREYQATWTQPPSGPPQFALSDGSPAPIAPGEVWISLVALGQPATLVR